MVLYVIIQTMKNIDATALPNDIDQLKKLVLLFQNEAEKYQEQAKEYQAKYEHVLEQWQLATTRRFASSSEAHPGQGELFNEIEAELEPTAEEVAEAEAATETITYTRKKARAPRIAEDLPRKDVVHDIADEDKICDCCGGELHKVGEETSEKVVFVPAEIIVERHTRNKYSCRHCDKHGEKTPFKTAPVPLSILPKSIATPSLLTQIITAKYYYGLPLYRQEKLFSSFGIELNRQTMSRWLVKVSERCKPLYDYLHRRLLEQSAIWSDDTRLKVIETEKTQCTMWVYGCGGDSPSPVTPYNIALYDYQDGRAGHYVTKFLQGYSGLMQVDGYQAYHQTQATLAGCWAHARRKFIEAKSVQPKGKTGRADVVLNLIQKLYAIETSIKELTVEQRRKARQERSLPIIQQIKDYLDKAALLVPPKSAIGLAVHYTLNQWSKLLVYLDHGELSIDNNRAERAVKPFVIGRKNWLFANTRSGASASAILYSLVETANANSIRPEHYLQALFEQLPTTPAENIEQLMPWNIKLN